MNIKELLSKLLQFSKEREWFEFKTNWFEEEKIDQYIYNLLGGSSVKSMQ